MPVVIEELDVQVQPQPSALAPAAAPAGGGAAVDERALTAILQREAWRQERLAAD